MRGSRVFLCVCLLVSFRHLCLFSTYGIYITPQLGFRVSQGTWELGQRGLDTKLAYSAFGLLSFFRGYAVDEWDGSPDTLWAATNCREKRGEVTAHGHGLLGYRQDSGLFGLITCQNTSDCIVNVMCQVKVGGAVMFLCCWSLGMRPGSCL